MLQINFKFKGDFQAALHTVCDCHISVGHPVFKIFRIFVDI